MGQAPVLWGGPLDLQERGSEGCVWGGPEALSAQVQTALRAWRLPSCLVPWTLPIGPHALVQLIRIRCCPSWTIIWVEHHRRKGKVCPRRMCPRWEPQLAASRPCGRGPGLPTSAALRRGCSRTGLGRGCVSCQLRPDPPPEPMGLQLCACDLRLFFISLFTVAL